MHIRTLATAEDFSHYDTWVKAHPQGNLWQSLEWKRYQETLGREVKVYVVEEGGNLLASALVVIDRTTGGLSTWDVARGPLVASSLQLLVVRNTSDALLDAVLCDARQDGGLALYLSPLVPPKATSYKLQASPRHEQPEATRVINLTKTAEEILAQMHPKGRYNIHVAQKNGVRIEESRDIDAFYSLLQQTAERDGFKILPLQAYKAFLECLPGSFLLLAFETRHKPIAGLLGIVWPPATHPDPLPLGEGKTGIYYYGASDHAHRALMAPYALQWEAMRRCKAQGCRTYDLLGITPPTPLTLTLSRGERELPPPWAGVSTFKEKFGGTVVAYPPEQQIVLRSLLWKMLQWKRRILG